MWIRVKNKQGHWAEVRYKPTAPIAQARAVAAWLIKERGRQPSEADEEVAAMNKARLRHLYQSLVILGSIQQQNS